jgi:hypothetical protein
MHLGNTCALFFPEPEYTTMGNRLGGCSMSFFVNVRTNELVLREGKEPIADLYDACGRAALLASDLTDRYSGTIPPRTHLLLR